MIGKELSVIDKKILHGLYYKKAEARVTGILARRSDTKIAHLNPLSQIALKHKSRTQSFKEFDDDELP